jgi:hypothetical protein
MKLQIITCIYFFYFSLFQSSELVWEKYNHYEWFLLIWEVQVIWSCSVYLKPHFGKNGILNFFQALECMLISTFLRIYLEKWSIYNSPIESFLCCRFDGFTSTFQDKMFRGYDMEIHNQIFYTTLCSCILSLTGWFKKFIEFLYWTLNFVIHIW